MIVMTTRTVVPLMVVPFMIVPFMVSPVVRLMFMRYSRMMVTHMLMMVSWAMPMASMFPMRCSLMLSW
jgi:hypothetical protein